MFAGILSHRGVAHEDGLKRQCANRGEQGHRPTFNPLVVGSNPTGLTINPPLYKGKPLWSSGRFHRLSAITSRTILGDSEQGRADSIRRVSLHGRQDMRVRVERDTDACVPRLWCATTGNWRTTSLREKDCLRRGLQPDPHRERAECRWRSCATRWSECYIGRVSVRRSHGCVTRATTQRMPSPSLASRLPRMHKP